MSGISFIAIMFSGGIIIGLLAIAIGVLVRMCLDALKGDEH